jgi:hypothetical protein
MNLSAKKLHLIALNRNWLLVYLKVVRCAAPEFTSSYFIYFQIEDSEVILVFEGNNVGLKKLSSFV